MNVKRLAAHPRKVTMTRTITVTRAEKLAAQYAVEIARKEGRPVREAVRMIAEAREVPADTVGDGREVRPARRP
jgi:membrane-bound ClpP family serine protease